MPTQKVVTKRVVSPDGRIVAEARSVVVTDGDDNLDCEQTVHVEYSTNEFHGSSHVSCSAVSYSASSVNSASA